LQTSEVSMIKRSRSGSLFIRRTWPSFHPLPTPVRGFGSAQRRPQRWKAGRNAFETTFGGRIYAARC
ncbi:hypothetical protein, partial [Streptomyces sp. NPDC002088]|uniref:hypothetical protein n=1 Tax=Streptomyces sp. NPDC002088 TaxID=3154665 RepID=UPI0033347CF0